MRSNTKANGMTANTKPRNDDAESKALDEAFKAWYDKEDFGDYDQLQRAWATAVRWANDRALPPYTTAVIKPPDEHGGVTAYQNSSAPTDLLTATAAAQPVPWKDAGGHEWEIRQGVTCVECPHCLFTFAAIHTVKPEDYDCPNCDGCPDAAALSSTPGVDKNKS